MKTILFLAANPKNTEWLSLDKEVKQIEAELERAKIRDKFKLIQKWAVDSGDLRRALLDHNPDIVHFAGHGIGSKGIVLDDAGKAEFVGTKALTRLLSYFKEKIECVVLNACYSEEQATAIHQHIPCVIGMSQAIGDQAAIKFSGGFYGALGAGRSYENAFEMGCIAIDLKGIPESVTPVLKHRTQCSHKNETEPKLDPDPKVSGLLPSINSINFNGNNSGLIGAGENIHQRMDRYFSK